MSLDPSLLHRVREEFIEMPGLQLTCRQAQRLWDLDEAACRELLAALQQEGFLRRAASGTFVYLDLPDRDELWT